MIYTVLFTIQNWSYSDIWLVLRPLESVCAGHWLLYYWILQLQSVRRRNRKHMTDSYQGQNLDWVTPVTEYSFIYNKQEGSEGKQDKTYFEELSFFSPITPGLGKVIQRPYIQDEYQIKSQGCRGPGMREAFAPGVFCQSKIQECSVQSYRSYICCRIAYKTWECIGNLKYVSIHLCNSPR